MFGVRNQQGAPTIPAIERLRAIAPHVGLFVVEERSNAVDPWLPRLAASGADDAFALDRPGDEKLMREVLANRVALPPPEEALRRLWALWADWPVRTEAMHCVRNAYRPRHRFVPPEMVRAQADDDAQEVREGRSSSSAPADPVRSRSPLERVLWCAAGSVGSRSPRFSVSRLWKTCVKSGPRCASGRRRGPRFWLS